MWESNHFQVSRDKGCGNGEGLWGEVTSPADLGPVPAPVLLVCLSAPGHHCLLFPRKPSVAAKACLAPGSLHVDIDPQRAPFVLGLVIDLVTKQMGLELLILPALFLRICLSWTGRQDSQFCPITGPLVQPCRVTSATDQSNAQNWT